MLHIKTPLLLHPTLSTPSRRIWLKLENLQPSGSFKLRGVGLLCAQAAAAGAKRVVCASGGNAGFATAYAAAKLRLTVDIIVPESTPLVTREKIANLGAKVTVHGRAWDDANALALEWAREPGSCYVPAFDHPVLWEGHSSLIDEVLSDCPQVDTIIASVGGGGLISGVMQGLERNGRLDCKIIATETIGAASFAAALEAGYPVKLDKIDTVANCLGALMVASWPVEAIKRFKYQSLVLSDTDALIGTVSYAEDLRQLVEPACGVSLAVAYLDHGSIKDAKDVVVIVCGGVSTSAKLMVEWEARLHR